MSTTYPLADGPHAGQSVTLVGPTPIPAIYTVLYRKIGDEVDRVDYAAVRTRWKWARYAWDAEAKAYRFKPLESGGAV